LTEFLNKSEDNKASRYLLKRKRINMIDIYKDWIFLTSRMPQVVCREFLETETQEATTETIFNFEINNDTKIIIITERN
jgi:hypothetical protein